MLASILKDLKYANRQFMTKPLFHSAAVLTLGICTGATIALFSVMNGVLLRPLPYPNADRLVFIEGDDAAATAVSFPDYMLMRNEVRSLEEAAVWQGWAFTLPDDQGVNTRGYGGSVSANYFDILGVRPHIGQFFTPQHDASGHEPVVVLSYEGWRTWFGGDAQIIGKLIRIDTASYTVIGVAPPDFTSPLDASPIMWRAHPPEFDRGVLQPGWIGFWAIGRLREGVTIEQASDDLAARMQAEHGDRRASAKRIVSFRDSVVQEVRPTLIALLAAVAFVLLIGCANVANLLLSRASSRLSEINIRVALGASRGTVIRQLLVEGFLLATLGTVVGLAIAAVGIRALLLVFGPQLPRAEQVGIDWRVGLFAFALAIATSLLFALAPALQLTRAAHGNLLREGHRGSISTRTGRKLRQSLVILEAALSVVLLTGAGLLVRTLWQLQKAEPGFDARSALYARVTLPPARFTNPEQQNNVMEAIAQRLSATPGIEDAGAITDIPMSGAVNSTQVFRSDAVSEEEGMTALVRAVAGDYFPAMSIPLRRGRFFEPSDRGDAQQVALVNEAFARRMFDGQDPIGKLVQVRGVMREIVGVVASVQEYELTGDLEPVLYTHYPQEREAWMRGAVSFVARSNNTAEPSAIGPAMRRAVRDADPAVTVAEPRQMQFFVDRDLAAPKSRATLVMMFAAIAVVLATFGMGSVLAYSVSQRLPEMSIRMALGAKSGDVVGLVLAESARLVAAGVALGVAGAIITGRLISSFLYSVSATDPITLIASIVTIVLAALVATALPAMKGASVDPARVLRSE